MTLIVGDARVGSGVRWYIGVLDIDLDGMAPTVHPITSPVWETDDVVAAMASSQTAHGSEGADAMSLSAKHDADGITASHLSLAMSCVVLLVLALAWWRVLHNGETTTVSSLAVHAPTVHACAVIAANVAGVAYVWAAHDIVLSVTIIGAIVGSTIVATTVAK